MSDYDDVPDERLPSSFDESLRDVAASFDARMRWVEKVESGARLEEEAAIALAVNEWGLFSIAGPAEHHRWRISHMLLGECFRAPVQANELQSGLQRTGEETQ